MIYNHNEIKTRLEPYAFAVDLLKDPYYNKIAMAEEIGECLGKVKKWMRDDGKDYPFHISESRSLEIATELGDVLFYLVHLIDTTPYNSIFDRTYGNENSLHPKRRLSDALSIMSYNTAFLLTHEIEYQDNSFWVFDDCITHILRYWVVAASCLPQSTDEIIEILVNKISSRKERNVQHGSGDNR